MNMLGRTTAPSSRRRGAAAVEFAVVLPVFVLIVFSIIEFGRAMMVLGVITNAARSGARAGVVLTGTYTTTTAAVSSTLTNGGVSGTATITVTVGGTVVTNDTTFKAAAIAGATVSVRVSVNYSDVTWIPGAGWYLGSAVLTETAIMRREG